MKALLATAAVIAICVGSASAEANEGTVGNIQFSGKTIWTVENDLTEIARFPLGSEDPSFIVFVESMHPEDSNCSRLEDSRGKCERPNLCEIFVDVRRDLQPVRTEPIQPDPSRVLIAWYDEDSRDGNGHHMHPHWDFGILIQGNNNEGLWFDQPIIMRYGARNQQCMAGVKVSYYSNVKNIFNQWAGPPPPQR